MIKKVHLADWGRAAGEQMKEIRGEKNGERKKFAKEEMFTLMGAELKDRSYLLL